MKIFFANVVKNDDFNGRRNESYKRSISKHSDLTLQEKKKYRLGLKGSSLRTRTLNLMPLGILMSNLTIPEIGKNV